MILNRKKTFLSRETKEIECNKDSLFFLINFEKKMLKKKDREIEKFEIFLINIK